jgi:preprotein translocase subunit Sss1
MAILSLAKAKRENIYHPLVLSITYKNMKKQKEFSTQSLVIGVGVMWLGIIYWAVSLL